MRDFSSLYDHDFEMLVADLLEEEVGVRFERFARGPDHGIDLRSAWFGTTPDGDTLVASDGSGGGARDRLRRRFVVQCKHYLNSSLSQLVQAAQRERLRLDRAPSDLRLTSDDIYLFVTSQSLTPQAKASLVEVLAPYLTEPDRILP